MSNIAQARKPRFSGIFPVAPTTFTESGELDLASQKRCIDFMIDAGSDGLCILANFSEQFLLADDAACSFGQMRQQRQGLGAQRDRHAVAGEFRTTGVDDEGPERLARMHCKVHTARPPRY